MRTPHTAVRDPRVQGRFRDRKRTGYRRHSELGMGKGALGSPKDRCKMITTAV